MKEISRFPFYTLIKDVNYRKTISNLGNHSKKELLVEPDSKSFHFPNFQSVSKQLTFKGENHIKIHLMGL